MYASYTYNTYITLVKIDTIGYISGIYISVANQIHIGHLLHIGYPICHILEFINCLDPDSLTISHRYVV